jgi:hypothetical protein
MADSETLFDHDPATGMTEYFHYDEATGGFVIETRQDVGLIIELNKSRYNETEKHTPYGELDEVANFPLTIVMELAKQGIMTAGCRILDQKKYKQWLNDPANEMWRVRRGKV